MSIRFENGLGTEEQWYELVNALINLVGADKLNDIKFQEILHSLPHSYSQSWVSGTLYKAGEAYDYNGVRYFCIVDITDDVASNEPYLATMRNFTIPFKGFKTELWAFKEPILQGMIRYPYQSTNMYMATRNITSDENTIPPNEDTTGLWELISSGII